tara:strand:+ start:228099 stop:228563 length:465 start_codon:yes stop_codon:yes gene_type:complete
MQLTSDKLAKMSLEEKIVAGLRIKLRFVSQNVGGRFSIEDLYEMPLTFRRKDKNDEAYLDEIAIKLDREIKEAGELSFVKRNKVNVKTQLAFDIVKGIIESRIAEDDAARAEAELRAKEKELMAQLDRIEQRELENKSADEVRAELDALRKTQA